MKPYYIVIIIFALLFNGCKIQKHLEAETKESMDSIITQTTNTDKNTIKEIEIIKYSTVYDTITNEYPIESITKIKEENKDKIKQDTNKEIHGYKEETIKEDTETKPSIANYIYSFLAGMGLVILIWIAVIIIRWYIKKKIK